MILQRIREIYLDIIENDNEKEKYNYEFLINDDNELDDINLIKKVKVDATTERVIEVLEVGISK